MVIQLCQENFLAKLKVAGHVSIQATNFFECGKVMPGDAATPNAGPGLLFNCSVNMQKLQNTCPPYCKNGFLN